MMYLMMKYVQVPSEGYTREKFPKCSRLFCWMVEIVELRG